MNKMKRKNYIWVRCFLLVGILCMLSGCGSSRESEPVQSTIQGSGSGFVVYGPGSYDSADTPVLIQKNTEDKTLTFLNLELGKQYTLSYDGTTCFFDKYGMPLSLEQVAEGDILDITFIKSKKHLTQAHASTKAWVNVATDQYLFDYIKREVTIGEDVYKISSDVCYFSDGKQVEEMDINVADVLTFQGIGTTIYSVDVAKGHGYLRLTGQEAFIGGWIEIGTRVIERVTDDMLITVPEGNYEVYISYAGTAAAKQVKIQKNTECSVDFSDVEIKQARTGLVVFSLTPVTAELYVDGTQVDTTKPVELNYGLHQLICRAKGYDTITQYLSVGQENAGISITLEKSKEEEKTDVSSGNGTANSGNNSGANTGGNTSSGGSGSSGGSSSGSSSESGENGGGSQSGGTGTTTNYYKVFVDAPEKVEVYLDGSYVGISPCQFKKEKGTHVLTFCKEGYETRSYTVQVDDEDKDISYSFVDLEPINQDGEDENR